MTHELAVDVCIVGAGPAGLAAATALAGARLSVCVIEAGTDSPDTGRLPHVDLDADNPYPDSDVDHSHAAMVGGTAGLWSFELAAAGDTRPQHGRGCRYAPLQPLDFRARPEIGTPGWDLDPAELDTWYARAHPLCGLGPYRYDVAAWTGRSGPQPLDLGERVATSMFQFGPATAWTQHARDDLVAADNVTILTGAAALWLERDPQSRRVTAVRVSGVADVRRVTARTVILAAGSLETVRLLLDTDRRDPEWRPGNHADLVGRFFMEHPLVRGGLLVTDPARRVIGDLGLYGTRRVGDTCVSAKFTLTDHVVAAEGLLATSTLLVPRDRAYATPGALAFSRVRSPSGRQDPWRRRLRDVATIGRGAPDVARAVLASRHQPDIDRADWAGPDADPRWSVFELIHQTEQSPDPANRLTLGDEVDDLGRRRLRLNWRWSTDDQDRVGRARDVYAAAFAAAGVGRVVGTDWDQGRPRFLGGTHHHLGVTRMSRDPAAGVVDGDCRVHGVPNLYLAGGGVFPSSGFVNPTLTVVALALRVGARVRAELGETVLVGDTPR